MISTRLAKNYWPNEDPSETNSHWFLQGLAPRGCGASLEMFSRLFDNRYNGRKCMYLRAVAAQPTGQGYRVVNFVVRSNTSAAEVIPAIGLSCLKSISRTGDVYIRTVEDYASNQTLGTGSTSHFLEFWRSCRTSGCCWRVRHMPIQLTSAPTKLAFAWHWRRDPGTFLPSYFAWLILA